MRRAGGQCYVSHNRGSPDVCQATAGRLTAPGILVSEVLICDCRVR